MTRTYQVKYKSKSKMLTTPEKVEEVMNRVVNVFRRIDDKSEVSYKFALNA